MNVHVQSSIVNAFQSIGIQYDLIIEDSTQMFEGQVRFIENAHPYLKPGGYVSIIEDIAKSYKEQDYMDRLKPILDMFQDYYFVSMDHINRNSIGWDNDKLLVLVKAGVKPISRTKRKLQSLRRQCVFGNLPKVKKPLSIFIT